MTETTILRVGWIDLAGDENCAPLGLLGRRIETIEEGLGRVAQMDKAQAEPGHWFLMGGSLICDEKCADCHGQSAHHWLLTEATPDKKPAGEMVLACKHCPTWRSITDFDADYLN